MDIYQNKLFFILINIHYGFTSRCLNFLFLPIGKAKVYGASYQDAGEIQDFDAEAYMDGLLKNYSYVINGDGVNSQNNQFER